MNDDLFTLTASDLAQAEAEPGDFANAPVSRRGRKPGLTIMDKVAALKAQLAEAEAKARETEKGRAGIVGKAVIEAMKANEAFAALVRPHLRERVRSARDKATIADLLVASGGA